MTGRAYASILRFKVDCLDHRRNIGALLGDRACKFLWAADVEDLAGRFEPVADAPEHFGARIKTEIAKWAKVVHDANIKAD